LRLRVPSTRQNMDEEKPSKTRRFLIGGVWNNVSSDKRLANIVEFLNESSMDLTTEVALYPHPDNIQWVCKNLKIVNCSVGSQHVVTGAAKDDNSVEKQAEFGVKWAMFGHMDFRKEGDTAEAVGKKVAYCLQKSPVKLFICLGEKQDEQDKVAEALAGQLAALCGQIEEEQWANVVLAYQPDWANDKNIFPKQVMMAMKAIRSWVGENASQEIAEACRIVYGGPVSGYNCRELAKIPDLDGFLVGQLSMKPELVNLVNSRTERPLAFDSIIPMV